MFYVPAAQLIGLCVSPWDLPPDMLLIPLSVRTSDLNPLRRMRLGSDQVCILQEEL